MNQFESNIGIKYDGTNVRSSQQERDY